MILPRGMTTHCDGPSTHRQVEHLCFQSGLAALPPVKCFLSMSRGGQCRSGSRHVTSSKLHFSVCGSLENGCQNSSRC